MLKSPSLFLIGLGLPVVAKCAIFIFNLFIPDTVKVFDGTLAHPEEVEVVSAYPEFYSIFFVVTLCDVAQRNLLDGNRSIILATCKVESNLEVADFLTSEVEFNELSFVLFSFNGCRYYHLIVSQFDVVIVVVSKLNCH